jgi:hypothetical protein
MHAAAERFYMYFIPYILTHLHSQYPPTIFIPVNPKGRLCEEISVKVSSETELVLCISMCRVCGGWGFEIARHLPRTELGPPPWKEYGAEAHRAFIKTLASFWPLDLSFASLAEREGRGVVSLGGNPSSHRLPVQRTNGTELAVLVPYKRKTGAALALSYLHKLWSFLVVHSRENTRQGTINQSTIG